MTKYHVLYFIGKSPNVLNMTVHDKNFLQFAAFSNLHHAYMFKNEKKY